MSNFPFKPAKDAEPAQWLEASLIDFAWDVVSIVPRGFEAYARVFHPAWRVTQETRTPLRWAEVAARTGRVAHRKMQWPSIGGEELPGQGEISLDKESVWFEPPEEGSLPLEVVRALRSVLTQHTTTPERCYFAIWEGFGGLSRSVLEAPAFEIPARRFHLFEAPIQAIESTFYTDDVDDARSVEVLIWFDSTRRPTPEEIAEARRSLPKTPLGYQSANLWWPADRAWCVHTEIDFNTTYISGSREVVDAVLADNALEACQVDPADDITVKSDTINLP